MKELIEEYGETILEYGSIAIFIELFEKIMKMILAI